MKTVDAAYNGHANSYVTKPFDMEGLYALVESIESFWVRTPAFRRRKRMMEVLPERIVWLALHFSRHGAVKVL
jgi:hypothetical protein